METEWDALVTSGGDVVNAVEIGEPGRGEAGEGEELQGTGGAATAEPVAARARSSISLNPKASPLKSPEQVES